MNEESLMRSRIRKILMICSNYDAFALEEDGRIENQVKNEYRELNLSNPPKFIWANSSAQARDIIGSEEDIDMIICMYNEQDKEIFPFASRLKDEGRGIPFILLIHYSKAVRQRVLESPHPGVDFVFSWHGNADLILAIVKLLEDAANAAHHEYQAYYLGGPRGDNSLVFYGKYVPAMKAALQWGCEQIGFAADGLQQLIIRKRSNLLMVEIQPVTIIKILGIVLLQI